MERKLSLAWQACVVVSLSLASCDRSDHDAARWLDLEIVRPEVMKLDPVEVKEALPDADDMLLKTIPVPISIFFNSVGSGNTSDPFADRVITPRRVVDLQKEFERAGITFAPGTYVLSNPASPSLVVRQTPEQMDLMLAYMESMGPFHTPDIVTRVEIYEMPEELAMLLIRSASLHLDHNPEKELIRSLLREAKAHLVQSTTLHTRSGQRARIEDGYEFSYPLPAKFENAGSENFSSRFHAGELTRTVGTWFEIDTVVSADLASCEISVKLEFHVSDPTWSKTLGSENGILKATRFPRVHLKTLSFNDILKFGDVHLVGSWRPGTALDEKGQRSLQLVFIQVFLQPSESTPVP